MKKILILYIFVFFTLNSLCSDTNKKEKNNKQKKEKVVENVVVTADLHKQETFQTSIPVNNIGKEKLKKENPTNLIKVLELEPGITVSQTGNGSVRPVIRGLYDERVLTLLNGIRLAEQFGGGNHSYSIEPFMLSNVEIVRGPSSVLYGTDAIGGVLNFFTKGFGFDNMSENEIYSSYHSATNGHTEAIFYSTGSKNLNGFINIVNKDFKNIETPDAILKNSAINGTFINSGLNYQKEDWDFSLNYYGMEGDVGVPINPNAIDMGFKDNNYKRTQFVYNKYDISPLIRAFQITGAIQYKHRNMFIESPFDENLNKIYQINVNKSSKNLNSHFHLLYKNHIIVTGLNFFDETSYSFTYSGFRNLDSNNINKEMGRGVIPESSRNGIGLFIQDEVSLFDNLIIKTGVRWDTVKANAPYNPKFKYSGVSNTDSGISGGIGFVYNYTPDFVIFGHYGTAFRSPSLLERFFYGVHQDSVDVGNPNLKFEKGKNIDFGIRLKGEKTEISLSLFRNRITNYISSTFSGEFDIDSGLEIHTWKNLKTVELTGGELEFNYYFNNFFQFTSTLSSVTGKDKTNNAYLREIPPLKFVNTFKLNSIELKNGCIFSGNFNILSMDKQDKLGEFENETPGYTIFNFLSQLKYKKLTFSFEIENIGDKSYHSHLSRIRYMNEQQGRSFNFNLKWNF